jgi:hypothetical protein
MALVLPGTARAGTVNVKPGDNLPVIVSSNPAGTTFQFAAGQYRMAAPIVPLTGDVFVGAAGKTSVLTGATVVSSFAQQGSYWTAILTLDHVNPVCASGPCKCSTGFPACDLSEDLFIDNKLLQRMPALSEVAPGKWFWDRSTGVVYLVDNPTGHVVEVSTAAEAFTGVAGNVTINGLTIEKFAGQGIQARIVNSQEGHGWIVENCNIQYGHVAGISDGSQMQVLNNKICNNGKLGIEDGGTMGNLIQGNEICSNNYAGFFEDSGGAKFTVSSNLTVNNNYVHDNLGVGLHTDGGSIYITYENNHTTRNQGPAIYHEASHAATIKDNVVENDAFVSSGTSVPHGSGILIYDSDNVDVYGNTVKDSMNGIAGYQFPRTDGLTLKNLSVHNNVITQASGAAGGILIYTKDTSFYPMVFTTWNNHWDNNTYCLSNPSAKYFDWQLTQFTYSDWQKTYGQDVHSVLSCSTTQPAAATADFTISPAQGTLASNTIAPGQTAQYQLTLTPLDGFTGTVALGCSGAPSNSLCTVSPGMVQLSGTAGQNAAISVATAAGSSMVGAYRKPGNGPVNPWPRAGPAWILLAGAALVLSMLARQKFEMVMARAWTVAPLLLFTLLLSSCAMTSTSSKTGQPPGSNPPPSSNPPPTSTPPPSGGTPAGSSTITVTATSGSLSHTAILTLTVN